MKRINLLILVIKIIFFLSIYNTIHAKNLDKYYNEDNISNYFSGVLSLKNNDYVNSYKYLKQLNGLEDKHNNYSKLYEFTLLNSERFNEAFIYSKKLESKKLDGFESNLIIGIFYLKKEEYKKASKYFDKIVNIETQDPFKVLLSQSLKNWNSFYNIKQNEALDLIEKSSSTFEKLKLIQKTFANCYYESESTVQKFDDLVKLKNTDLSRYNFFYANYLSKINKRNEAINIVNNSLKASPRNLLLNQQKIDLKNEKKLFINNEFNCKKISNVLAEIFYITASALASQSLYTVSNFYLNIAKFLNPNFISFDTLYAENLNRINKTKKAKNIYEKIKKKGSVYNWYAAKQIARILFRDEKKEEAIIFLDKNFNKINNPNLYTIYDFADFLKNNEKFKESIIQYSRVLEAINKNHYLYAEASEGRGIAYERSDQWKKAENDFLNSLKASPNQPYVINYLAYSWIEKGLYIEKSLKMLEKANELKKNDGYIIDSLGWALFKLKKYKKAKEYLELAVRIMPSDPIVNDHFGDSLWMTNKNIQARYYWNYVLDLKKTELKLKKNVKRKLTFGLNITP